MSRQPAAGEGTRRPWLGMLIALALGWALVGPAGAATAPDPAAPDAGLAARAPGTAIVAAQRQLDVAQALLRQAEQAQRETGQLQDQLTRLDSRWQQGAAADQAAQAAVQTVETQALPALRAAQRDWANTQAEVSRLAARHQAAVAAVAQAPARQRAAAMAEADAQARARALAEPAHQTARQRHHQAIDDAWRAADRATDRRNALQGLNDELASQLADAAQRWAAVDARWRALQRAAAADAAPRPPLATPGGLVPAQAPWAEPAQAGAAEPAHAGAAEPAHAGAAEPAHAGAAEPAHAGAAVAGRRDTGPLDDWRSAAKALDLAQDASWLRSDAAAFVRQTLITRGNCPSAACANWQAERQALADELAQLAATEADASARFATAQALADTLPPALAERLIPARAQRQALSGAVALARGPGQQALRALTAAGQQALANIAAARQQAARDFAAAWRAQYGQDPDLRQAAPAPAHAAPPAPYPAAAAAMMPMLRQHALHRMTQRNDEPPGFGAYTYVVVGTATGLDSTGVRQRLARLLAALQNLTPAEQIEAEQRLGTHVFVVPVQAGSLQQATLAYALRLAQALMSHVPPALLMPGRLQRALLTSNGPFLITLPGRLADAQASWPVLFADLDSVPEAVVADVVRSYMGDLLVGFKPSDAGWRPPALQRVALTLVRLVQGTGEVVMAAFPASIATPAPR